MSAFRSAEQRFNLPEPWRAFGEQVSQRLASLREAVQAHTRDLPRPGGLPYCTLLVAVLITALYVGFSILWLIVALLLGVGLVDATLLCFTYRHTEFSQTLQASIIDISNNTTFYIKQQNTGHDWGCRTICLYNRLKQNNLARPTLTLNEHDNSIKGRLRRYRQRRQIVKPWRIPDAVPWHLDADQYPGELSIGIFQMGVYQVKLLSPLTFFSLTIGFGQSKLHGFPLYLTVRPNRYPLPDLEEQYFQLRRNPLEGEAMAAGSREYSVGDSLHSINWKQSAAKRKLMVKEFDASNELSAWELYLGPLEEAARQPCERALTAAYSTACYLCERYDNLSFRHAAEFDVKQKFTAANVNNLATLLAQLELEVEPGVQKQNEQLALLADGSVVATIIAMQKVQASLQHLLRLPAGSLIVICGRRDVEPLEGACEALLRAGQMVLFSEEIGEFAYVD